MNRLELPPRPRILVVALRRLGDVLLTTPLIRSLRRAWPDATIEALVFADTAGILAGNPDLDALVEMAAQPTFAQSAALATRRWFSRRQGKRGVASHRDGSARLARHAPRVAATPRIGSRRTTY